MGWTFERIEVKRKRVAKHAVVWYEPLEAQADALSEIVELVTLKCKGGECGRPGPSL